MRRSIVFQAYDSLSATEKTVYDAVGDLKAYTVFNLGGRYKLSDKTTLNATIYNLFDKDFLDGRELSTGGYDPYFIQSGRSVDGTVEQGRRLWLSISTEF